MNKFIPSLLGLAAGLTFTASQSHAAVISGFNGFFAEAQWSVVGTPDGDVAFTTSSLSLTSADDDGDSFEPHTTFVYVMAPFDGTVDFRWSYESTDADSSWDPAGWFIALTLGQPSNLIPGDLSSSSPSVSQNGIATFNVMAGDVFGFYAHTLDQFGGTATLTITDFTFSYDSGETSVIPEPGSVFAVGTLLSSGLFLRLRRKSRN